MVGPTTPLVVANAVPRLVVYFTESAKYASSAVTRFRRSDFIEARYAFSFVLANFGIAMAAKIPMITTTIRSSIRVKPLRFIRQPPRRGKSRTLSNEYSAAHISKRSEEHTSELQSHHELVCRLLLDKKNTLPISARRRRKYIAELLNTMNATIHQSGGRQA